MKLINGAASQQFDDDPSGPLIEVTRIRRVGGFDDLRFPVTAPEVLPGCFRRDSVGVKTERLIGKNQPVGMSVGQRKAVIIPAPFRVQEDFGLHAWGSSVPTVQLIVSSTVSLDKLAKAAPQHPTQHLEEADEIGLARTVGADQDGRVGQARQLNIGQGPEAADVNRVDLRHNHRMCSP